MIYQLGDAVVGVNPPADIASGRIAEVRSRSMSCNCMTRTSQQECRGILEYISCCVRQDWKVLKSSWERKKINEISC